MLTASDDGTARLWEAESGKLLVTFQGHTDRVTTAVSSVPPPDWCADFLVWLIFRIYLEEETAEKHWSALLEFADRVERLPIAVVVGADMLRRELDPIPEAARGLRLERLRNEVQDVAQLLRRAIAALPEELSHIVDKPAAKEAFFGRRQQPYRLIHNRLLFFIEAGLLLSDGNDIRNPAGRWRRRPASRR